MKFFRLDSSLRTEGSVSRRLADTVEEQWLRRHPDATVVRRDLGQHPLPPVWPAAVGAAMAPADQPRTPEQQAASTLAAELVDELLAADAYVFAVPLYNWNFPAQVKLWIDLVITDPRAAAGNPTQLLAGRPAVLVQARGGGYAPGTPREGWDHATPYLTRILRDHWGLDLAIADAELTLAEVNPAMAHLRDAAAQQLASAQELAGNHGASIAEGLPLSA